jgi:glutamyl-tRNA synthetase
MSEIRLRLAPSPTGFLHLGNLRTALFGYLLSRNLGGSFILRIEDTDQKREVAGAVDSLINILNWVGIKFSEGPHCGGEYGPYIQSQRNDIYQEYIKLLLEKGGAYYCFCTPERLQNMREEQQAKKQPPRYDRCCRDLTAEAVRKRRAGGEKFVIRQKMPLHGEVIVHDELRGEIKFAAADLEDHVLIKSDNLPTYQFASVIDDHEMKISHVTRGEEWIPSLPKNVLLYQSFGWEVPKFIHLPLIMNKQGGKLSKRQGDVFVEDYKQKGYLAEALINFCALLGWHPKDDQEIFTMDELEKIFTLRDIRTSPAVFDVDKLDFFNATYIRKLDTKQLVAACRPYLTENIALTTKPEQQTDEYLAEVLILEQERMKTLSEAGEKTRFFFVDQPEYESSLLIWKQLTAVDVKNNLTILLAELKTIEEWNKENLDKHIVAYLLDKKYKIGDYLWPLRVALTGEKNSPGPFEVAAVLGKAVSLQRVQFAIDSL